MTAESLEPRSGSGEMFDAIAPRYDLLNRLMSLGIDRRWRRKAVASLRLKAGQTLVDLATGTADVAILAARQEPGLQVRGIDPSERMLEFGRGKVERAGLADRLTLSSGSAEALPLENESVDAISMAFGIRNVPDRPKALAEMRRVLRVGGRVAILELSEPRGGPLGAIARFHVHEVVPRLGAWLSGAREYRYLQSSIAAFPPPDSFAQLMRDAGFSQVKARPLTFGTCCLFTATVLEQSS